MKLPISTEQAEEIIKKDIAHVVATLERALDAIKNPSSEQVDMEGAIAKIYISEGFISTLDGLADMQLQLRAERMRQAANE